MTPGLDDGHQAVAELRASLREAYDAADRLCTVFLRAKNGVADQPLIDKAVRRVYSALHGLEQAAFNFNAVVVRVRDGDELKDGNGKVLAILDNRPPPDDEPGGVA